jgi:hypothetical protein
MCRAWLPLNTSESEIFTVAAMGATNVTWTPFSLFVVQEFNETLTDCACISEFVENECISYLHGRTSYKVAVW